MARGYLQIVQLHADCKNGSLRILTAGSTYLATIYDPVSGAPISNPVSIDSEGYAQAFTVDSDVLYDVVAVDYLGAVKLTRESVSVIGGTSGARGPQGIQGDKGDKGDKGDTGAAGQAGTNGTNGADGIDGADGSGIARVWVDETSSTGKLLYTLTSDPENAIEAGDTAPGGLGQVRVVGGDGLGYLAGKVVDGEGIAVEVTESNKLKVSNTAPDTLQTKAHAVSAVPGFLSSIVQAGTGINVSLSTDMEKIVLTATGSAVGGFFWKGTWSNEGTYNANNAVWYFDHTGELPVSRLYIATTQNQGINPLADAGIGTGTCWSCMMAVDYMGDQFVMLDATDTQAGFLADKLKAGQYVTLTKTSVAGGSYYTVDCVAPYSIKANGVTKTYSNLGGLLEMGASGGCSISWVGNVLTVNGVAIGETSATAYRGDRGKIAYDHSQATHAPANADNTQVAISGAPTKTTPVDADAIPLVDSAAANTLKRVTWASIKTTLKSYLDTLYSAVGHSHTASVITSAATGDVAATNVQAAIAELASEKLAAATASSTYATIAQLNAHTGASSGAHAASSISFSAIGGVAATTVQAAIAELDSEKQSAITSGTTAQYYRGDKSWQDLAGAVRSVALDGLSTATNVAIAATDTVLGAFGKLQAQITANLGTLTSHTGNTSNPHGVTKAQVGLDSVDNTSDKAKPISDLTAAALGGKVDKITKGGIKTYNQTSSSRWKGVALIDFKGQYSGGAVHIVINDRYCHYDVYIRGEAGASAIDIRNFMVMYEGNITPNLKLIRSGYTASLYVYDFYPFAQTSILRMEICGGNDITLNTLDYDSTTDPGTGLAPYNMCAYDSLNYVNSLTSDAQTQLNDKQATITGAATTIDTENLTASRALISDANGKVAVSSVNTVELGYLGGVTSAIQGQLDDKLSKTVTTKQGMVGELGIERTNATDVVISSKTATDTHNRLQVTSSGQISWGSGTSGRDTNLYRNGVGDLATGGKFDAVEFIENGTTLANKYAAKSHTHGNLSNDGKLGTTAGLPVNTGTGGVIQAVAWSTNNPKVNGTASPGTATVPSREDHVHGTDTSRASVEALAAASYPRRNAGTINADTTISSAADGDFWNMTGDYTVTLSNSVAVGTVIYIGHVNDCSVDGMTITCSDPTGTIRTTKFTQRGGDNENYRLVRAVRCLSGWAIIG